MSLQSIHILERLFLYFIRDAIDGPIISA